MPSPMWVAAGLHCPFKRHLKWLCFFSLSLLHLIATLMGGFFLATADPLEVLAKNIPGTPGDDYPIFAQVPPTSFFCSGLTPGGYYADPATDCQVFHICVDHHRPYGNLAKYSFLCPNGTIFNQVGCLIFLLSIKMWGHPRQLKKWKSWEPFWSY